MRGDSTLEAERFPPGSAFLKYRTLVRALVVARVGDVLRLRHLFRMTRDVTAYAIGDRVWWLLPVILVLGLAGLAVSAANTALPYAVYTFF